MAADEMVDVFNELSEKTGQAFSKRQIHDEGMRHAAVHVWIYNSKGEILLQHRLATKEIFPDTLDISVAGHLTSGDTPLEAAVRESQEEIGLAINPDEMRFIGITRTDMPIPPRNWMHRVYDWNYIVHKDIAIEDLTIQADELAGVVWMPLDQFENQLHDSELVQKYSPHPLWLYDMALFEIRKALAEKEGKMFTGDGKVVG